MRTVFLRVSVNTDALEGETLEATADRVADEITDILREASSSASITPTYVYKDEKDEEGIDLGN